MQNIEKDKIRKSPQNKAFSRLAEKQPSEMEGLFCIKVCPFRQCLNKFVCNPHKYWILKVHFITRTQSIPSGSFVQTAFSASRTNFMITFSPVPKNRADQCRLPKYLSSAPTRLSSRTVSPNPLLTGFSFHDRNG